jgi:AcrR family transcriptional regulator
MDSGTGRTHRRQDAARDEDSSRVEILHGAAELFMDLGFKATTIDAIAERLGCTKGRIYYHFNSKAEIYFEVQRQAMIRLLDAVEPIARSEGSATERLSRMAFAHVDILLRELPLQKVAVHGLQLHHFSSSAARYTAQVREIVALRDEYEQIFAEVMDEGIREGSFVDLPPRLLAKPFFGALNWVTVWYRPRRLQNDDDLRTLASVLTEFAIRGLKSDGKD